MAEGSAPADSSWLIDMMYSIMHTPTWNEPLQAFYAEKCIMFDNFEEENKHEYVLVHNEFKSLVDNLLAAHLIEVDISPEDFERQLIDSGLVEDPRLHQVVGQLMAAEDFITFKNMMVERHVNMQMEAEGNYHDLTGPGFSSPGSSGHGSRCGSYAIGCFIGAATGFLSELCSTCCICRSSYAYFAKWSTGCPNHVAGACIWRRRWLLWTCSNAGWPCEADEGEV